MDKDECATKTSTMSFATYFSDAENISMVAVWRSDAGMVFALTLEWARRCFKKALDEKPCMVETKILH